MKVRNPKKTGIKGEWTEAAEKECPERYCFDPHDCGYSTSDGKWTKKIECLTRFYRGCPDEFCIKKNNEVD
jgi:hypothetical protein